MHRPIFLAALATALVTTTAARADHPVVDKIAQRVIEKYQSASCQQLAAEKTQNQGKPKPPMEQRAIQLLHEDAAARAEFFNKISAPIVTKLFECGMIP
jgi:hypothetical protein